jgi:hypothetical protein
MLADSAGSHPVRDSPGAWHSSNQLALGNHWGEGTNGTPGKQYPVPVLRKVPYTCTLVQKYTSTQVIARTFPKRKDVFSRPGHRPLGPIAVAFVYPLCFYVTVVIDPPFFLYFGSRGNSALF